MMVDSSALEALNKAESPLVSYTLAMDSFIDMGID